MLASVGRAAEWAGIVLSLESEERLTAYGAWLEREALPAGGLGPAEAPRIEERHLADSICFAGAWRDTTPPDRLLDVGSGVGLPGIPLAIVLPETQVTLVDRSNRRCTLMRRALRILDLGNVVVEEADVGDLEGRWPVVVARASLGPEEAAARLLSHVEIPGRLVLGGSHVEVPDAPGYEVINIPAEVLASPAWLLMMALP